MSKPIGYTASELTDLLNEMLGQRREADKVTHDEIQKDIIERAKSGNPLDIVFGEAIAAILKLKMLEEVLPELIEKNNQKLIDDLRSSDY